jgi:hypothetical protein
MQRRTSGYRANILHVCIAQSTHAQAKPGTLSHSQAQQACLAKYVDWQGQRIDKIYQLGALSCWPRQDSGNSNTQALNTKPVKPSTCMLSQWATAIQPEYLRHFDSHTAYRAVKDRITKTPITQYRLSWASRIKSSLSWDAATTRLKGMHTHPP